MITTIAFILAANQGRGALPTIKQLNTYRDSYEAALAVKVKSEQFLELAESYRTSLQDAKATPTAKIGAFVANIEESAKSNSYNSSYSAEFKTGSGKTGKVLKTAFVPIANVSLPNLAKLPDDVRERSSQTNALLKRLEKFVKGTEIEEAQTSIQKTFSTYPSGAFIAYAEQLNKDAKALPTKDSLTTDEVAKISALQANVKAYKGYFDRATAGLDTMNFPLTGAPTVEDATKDANYALDQILKYLPAYLASRVRTLQQEDADDTELIKLSAKGEEEKRTINLRINSNTKKVTAGRAELAALQLLFKGSKDEKVLANLVDVGRLLDLCEASTEMFKTGIDRSLNGWTEREIKLFYFDDVKQLVEMLGVETIKTVGTAGESDTRKNLRTAIAARAKVQGKVTDAKNNLLAATDALQQLERADGVKSADIKKKEADRKKTADDLNEQSRTLTEEKTRLATEKAINDRDITDTKDEISKNETALAAKPDDADLKAKRDKLNGRLTKLKADQRQNDRDIAANQASLDHVNAKVGDVPASTASADQTKLDTDIASLQTALTTAQTGLASANEEVRSKAVDAVIEAQAESLAFAKNRDSEPAFVSRPTDSKDADPLRRVFMYGLPDRRIIIRGRQDDVDRAFRVIFKFDQPQAQAELSLYSFEVNTPVNRGGRDNLSKNIQIIDSFSQQNESAMETVRDAIRDGLTKHLGEIRIKVKQAKGDKSGDKSSDTRPGGGLVFASKDGAPFDEQKIQHQAYPQGDPEVTIASLSPEAKIALHLDQDKLKALLANPRTASLILPRTTGLTTLAEMLSVMTLVQPDVRLMTIGETAAKIHGSNRLLNFLPTELDAKTFVVWANIASLENVFGCGIDYDIELNKTTLSPIPVVPVKEAMTEKTTDTQARSYPLTFQIQRAIQLNRKDLMKLLLAQISERSFIYLEKLAKGEPVSGDGSSGVIVAFRDHLCNELYERGCDSIRGLLPDLIKRSDSEELLRESLIYLNVPEETLKDKKLDEIKTLASKIYNEEQIFDAADIERRHSELSRTNEDFKGVMKRLDDSLRQAITEPILMKLYRELNRADSGVEVGFLQRQTMTARNRLVARMDPEASAELSLGSSQNILEDVGQLASIITNANGQSLPGVLDTLRNQRDSSKQEPNSARIFGVDSGSTFSVTPVFDPTGQALRFRFDYVYSNRITEPNGSSDPKRPQIARNTINTEVQLSNMEMKRIAEFTSVSKLGIPTRRQGGIPILRDIKGLDSWPLIGWFVQRSGQDAVAQHHILFSRAVMYPTISDIVDLLLFKSK